MNADAITASRFRFLDTYTAAPAVVRDYDRLAAVNSTSDIPQLMEDMSPREQETRQSELPATLGAISIVALVLALVFAALSSARGLSFLSGASVVAFLVAMMAGSIASEAASDN